MNQETRVGLFILVAVGIFLYLSINIRAIRFDKDQYNTYKAYFDDTSGLNVKAPVKIAGVDVGWVEEIKLLSDGKAELIMRILKTIRLSKNAFAMIHQDGLIGIKNLEIDPGDSSTGFLVPGSVLAMPGKAPTSVGELLDQFRDIASSIQDITTSFKNTFASRRGEENMRNALQSVTSASERIADFALVLQRTMAKNEDNINTMISDFKQSMSSLKTAVPAVQEDFHNVATSFNDAAVQGRETFREAGQVAEKINTGKGTIGKLINEDETYTDLKKTIKGFKEYVSKSTGLMVTVDMHSESMLRHTNSKGYFELRLRPGSDYFYNIQLVGDEQGSFVRKTDYIVRKDDKGNILKASEMNVSERDKIRFADTVERTVQTKNDLLWGLQFGKRFDRLAFRLGIFESSFGAACDFYVPLETDKIHWITTLEAFDFRGTKRLDDTRPHLKWINKLFFLKNIYTTFGIDDFYSKKGANPFWGGGLRFNDDDLKYFFGTLSGSGKTGR